MIKKKKPLFKLIINELDKNNPDHKKTKCLIYLHSALSNDRSADQL